jgi:hypothetical protein
VELWIAGACITLPCIEYSPQPPPSLNLKSEFPRLLDGLGFTNDVCELSLSGNINASA